MTKLALVTGGTRGIGAAIAVKLKADGYNVISTYIGHPENAEKFSKETGIKVYKFDVAYFESCQKGISEIEQAEGKNIDILINNAGITKDNLLMRMGEEDFDKVIEVNLKSVFNMTKAVQRTMLKQRQGSIINMSSVVGVKGNAGQTNYAASKAGIIGFSKSVALELGSRNIRSNVIAPENCLVLLVRTFDNMGYG